MYAHVINTHHDLNALKDLLQRCKLPFEDISTDKGLVIGYYNKEGRLFGTGALEIYGQNCLVRSISVDESERGRKFGEMIFKDLETRARARGVTKLFLLTETAEGLFRKLGFKDEIRANVPASLLASSEFATVCPASAVCMAMDLT